MALRWSVSGSLYWPSRLQSRTGTRRKRLQLSNERLFHEARHSETGREEDHVPRFLDQPTGN
jgi:hypothetical protein